MMATEHEQLLSAVKRIYSDPQAAVSRVGIKGHMDQIIVDLAILEVLQQILVAVEHRGRKAGR